jgi:hypothetical protein
MRVKQWEKRRENLPPPDQSKSGGRARKGFRMTFFIWLLLRRPSIVNVFLWWSWLISIARHRNTAESKFMVSLLLGVKKKWRKSLQNSSLTRINTEINKVLWALAWHGTIISSPGVIYVHEGQTLYIYNCAGLGSQYCDVVLVRGHINSGKPQGVGISEWGANGEGWRWGDQFTSNLGPG